MKIVPPVGLLVLAVLFGIPRAEGEPPSPKPRAVLGPGLRQLIHDPSRLPSNRGQVEVLLAGSPDTAVLNRLGVRAHTQAGEVCTATAPVSALSELDRVPGLRRAILARPLHHLLDLSIPSVRAGGVRFRENDTWSGLTGRGVVVGLVDSGVDWTHDDFKNPDGTTRIAYYWDQSDASGSPPTGSTGDTLYTYGTEWTSADIDGGSAGPGDIVGHGTHVAGIAAGSGAAAPADSLRYRFAGLAPEATMVVVAADLLLETGVLDGVNYIFEKANDLGMPAVVNLSLGTHFGPHDGTTLFEIGIDNLVGPGRLVVAAAGNSGDERLHAEIHVPGGGADSATVFVPFYTPNPSLNFFVVDAFYYRPDSLEVTVVTPSGLRLGPYGLGASVTEPTADGTFTLNHLDSDPSSGNLQVQFDASDASPDSAISAPPPASGEWRVVFRDLSGSPGGGEVDLWSAQASMTDFAGNRPYWILGHDPGEEIGVPATGNRVIAVGSYNTKQCWPDPVGVTQCTSIPDSLSLPERLTFFSSRGPTRDGREKPEITAPGFVVSSTLSHQMAPEYQTRYQLTRRGDPDGEHFVFAGTSMSAPHVTGAAAMLLQTEPSLTPEEFQTRIRNTARKDVFTGPGWTPSGGHGKLDVAALTDSVTAVVLREILIQVTESGFPRLTWQADPDDPVTGFRLEKKLNPGSWFAVHSFSGPGPHTWEDMAAEPEVRYRLLARLRDGRTVFWAETTWQGPQPGFSLGLIRPNPARGEIRIPFYLGEATLEIEGLVLDLSGRRVATLGEHGFTAGSGWVRWNGKNSRGERVPGGVYWILVQVGDQRATRKMVRLP